jgi:catechol 2,3-dioxygenase-like lactoylglutathione lyase family enzyme
MAFWRENMSRVQLALNVSDLDRAVEFYSKLFATAPAKIRPGYANFAVSDPPLKLVLVEKAAARGIGVDGALNHLGVEVESRSEVAQTSDRLSLEGLVTEDEKETTCCYAVQDKVWVRDPDGARWEVYTVLADAPVGPGTEGEGSCCASPARPVDADLRAERTTSAACC